MAVAALSLFDDSVDLLEYNPPEDELILIRGDFDCVEGLSFCPEFITSGEERVLLWQADREGHWSTHWSRRTKSFGSKYVRGTGAEEEWREAEPLPIWSDFIRCRLADRKITPRLVNQIGVNEYCPGQGIAQHVDYFGGTVVSLTLGSGCIMDFTHPVDHDKTVSIWLPRRSIVVLTGEARTTWRHGIKGRLKDIVNGRVVKRDRRVSLTFRDVVV
jgi:alkylated DNA repair dioxygenase AlkB